MACYLDAWPNVFSKVDLGCRAVFVQVGLELVKVECVALLEFAKVLAVLLLTSKVKQQCV